MRERDPITKTMKSSEARQKFSQLLNEVFRRESRVIVEKSGIPVAAIISAEDLKRLKQLEEQREEDFKALDATREAFKDVPPEEVEREVNTAINAIRTTSQDELASRQALVARILEESKERSIAPMTTAELVRQPGRRSAGPMLPSEAVVVDASVAAKWHLTDLCELVRASGRPCPPFR